MTNKVALSVSTAKRFAAATRIVEGNQRNMPGVRFRQGGGGDEGGGEFLVGQFTGAWPNEAGEDGQANIKQVSIYQPRSPMNGPNDFVPAQQTVTAINLFSYIPTPVAGDISLWCLLMAIPNSAGSYQSGTTYGQQPVITTYDRLWLLVAAEC